MQIKYEWAENPYVFKAPVEHLKLFLGELGLLLQFFQTLRPMAHGWEFKIILDAVCETQKCSSELYTDINVRNSYSVYLYITLFILMGHIKIRIKKFKPNGKKSHVN